MYPKRIDQTMRNEQRCMNSNGFTCCRCVSGSDCGGDRYQIGTSKGDTRRYCYLTKEIKPCSISVRPNVRKVQSLVPASNPRSKSSVSFWSKNCGPEIGTSAGWNCRNDLSHSKSDKHGYETQSTIQEAAEHMMNLLKKLTTIQPTDMTPGPPVRRP